MSCINCFKNNAEAFEKATCVFQSRRSLVLFLLNMVLNIKDLWEHYCFCDSSVILCAVCQFKIVYLNDEYDLYENSLDFNFLARFQDHVHKNLKRLLLETDGHFVCELINRKFFYAHKDWFTGKIEQCYLPYWLQVYENDKIKNIKNKEFKIVLDLIMFKKFIVK